MLLNGGTNTEDGALNFLEYPIRNFSDVSNFSITGNIENIIFGHFSRNVTEVILSSEKLLILECHISCHLSFLLEKSGECFIANFI